MEDKKILYIEAGDGISGDMTLGALVDLGVSVEDIKRELNKFVKEEYDIVAKPFERNGIQGTNLDVIVDVEKGSANDGNWHWGDHSQDSLPIDTQWHWDDHTHESASRSDSDDNHIHQHEKHEHTHMHEHNKYSDIVKMIDESGISERAKTYAKDIFSVIADGESHVHGISKDEIAFHEVGAMDSIIDIIGTAIAIDILNVSEFYCGKLHDGSGNIMCRHGLIPVPVPAVMAMMQGSDIPIVIDEDVNTEMITPTGFGIIKGLGTKFEPHLGIYADKVGYGFGKRETGRLGAVRITLGRKYEEKE